MDYLSPQTRQTRYRKKDGGYYPVIKDSDEDTKEQQSQNNNASPLKDVLLCRPRYATHLRTNRGKESKALFLGLRVSLLRLILRRGCLCSSLGRGRILAEAETLLRLLFYYRGDLSLLCTLFFAARLADALALCVFDFFAIQLPALEITTLYTPNKQLHGAAH